MNSLRHLLKDFNLGIEETVISLFDFIGDGLRIVDTSFRILYENQAHRALLGDHLGEYCYKAYQARDSVCGDCPVDKSFRNGGIHKSVRSVLSAKGPKYVEVTSSNLTDATGKVIAGIEIVRDVTERKTMEAEKEILISELQEALDSIKVLKGLIPICAWCRQVRDDKGYWQKVENYIEENSPISFTHGMCPACLQELDPEFEKTDRIKEDGKADSAC